MCGVSGVIDLRSPSRESLLHAVSRMTARLTHRGPDAGGTWADAEQGVALGHRRLAIVDLSSQGRQPMHSASGRHVTVFNGEIYNHREIRRELEASGARCSWRGYSDTEVMLAAIDRWGLHPALARFIGMYAFALWDKEEQTLHLVRDRMGEKPLYYGWTGKVFLFGSELKALTAHAAWHGEIDLQALTLYFRYGHIPAPYSIYRGIYKLPPASVLSLPRGAAKDRSYQITPYWSLAQAAQTAVTDPFPGAEAEAVQQLEALLRKAVAQQMLADVPLGAFLSGGVDSSLVVALMQAQSHTPVRTFSIGFNEAAYNEAERASAVARHLGTRHTELYVTPEQAMAVIPNLAQCYDEPFADPSQIPSVLVAQLARQHVTVSLSGDGGDELFGGYNRYFWGRRLWQKTGWLPPLVRSVLASAIQSLPPAVWDRGYAAVGKLIPAHIAHAGHKLYKYAELLRARDAHEVHRRLVSHWPHPAALVIGGQEPADEPMGVLGDCTQDMLYRDCMTYLPDDILVKLDRASMAVSLESRAPLLDHRVVEFAWRLPLSMKLRKNRGKWALRQVLHRYLPPSLSEWPKRGFDVPLATWLRGPLRDWAEPLLSERRLEQEGLIDAALVRAKWIEHLSGKRDWQRYLWPVLMFQTWRESQAVGDRSDLTPHPLPFSPHSEKGVRVARSGSPPSPLAGEGMRVKGERIN